MSKAPLLPPNTLNRDPATPGDYPQIESERLMQGTHQLEIAGLIEVEAGYEDPDDGDSASSQTLATAELEIAAPTSETVSGELVLLYEDDGEEPSAYNLEVDYGFTLAGREATVALGAQGSDEAEGGDIPSSVLPRNPHRTAVHLN